MFKAFLLIFLLGAVLLSRKPTKRSRKTPTYPPYDMKCDCGRRADDEKARNECEKSVKLGGSGRVIGGCKAGHIPWFVYFRIHQQFNCGGVLINKVREESETQKLTVFLSVLGSVSSPLLL